MAFSAMFTFFCPVLEDCPGKDLACLYPPVVLVPPGAEGLIGAVVLEKAAISWALE